MSTRDAMLIDCDWERAGIEGMWAGTGELIIYREQCAMISVTGTFIYTIIVSSFVNFIPSLNRQQTLR